MQYQVYTVVPALSNQFILQEGPLPATCKPGHVLAMTACRGEYESASFLIDTPVPLAQVKVEVRPLRGPVTLPVDCLDLRLVDRLALSISLGTAAAPYALVHNPDMLEIIEGYPPGVAAVTTPQPFAAYNPDWYGPLFTALEYKQAYTEWCVLRKPLIDAPEMLPVDVAKREQFWVTVRVPDDAPAGDYSANLVVRPENAAATRLQLMLRVPNFDLLPAKYEYSLYHPTDDLNPPITDAQMQADYDCMMAHGMTNPNFYAGPQGGATGPISFARLDRLLDMREKAGMPKGDLYVVDGAGLYIGYDPMTPERVARTTEVAAATVAWAKARGYGDVYFMGADEAAGANLTAQRPSWEAVHEGGAKIYAAGGIGFEPLVGDLLDVAVVADPDAFVCDHHQWTGWSTKQRMRGEGPGLIRDAIGGFWGSGALLGEPYQTVVRKQHSLGKRVFTYFDPWGQAPYPDAHRRCRGLGLYKANLDGTMTWAWTHYREGTKTKVGETVGGGGFIWRGPEGPIPTLGIVGYREGHDDARYLATLQARIVQGGPEARAAQEWLDGIGLRADLDAWRAGMVRWIERIGVRVRVP